MKVDVWRVVRILLGVGLLLCILIDTLIIEPVSNQNSILITGHFKRIEKFKLKSKLSISYNIFIQENLEYYKILPDWTNCFEYNKFEDEIKEGQLINIYIRKNNGLRSNDIPVIVSLVANNKDYLSQNCINKEIRDSKFKIPMILIGGLLLIAGLVYIEKKQSITQCILNPRFAADFASRGRW